MRLNLASLCQLISHYFRKSGLTCLEKKYFRFPWFVSFECAKKERITFLRLTICFLPSPFFFKEVTLILKSMLPHLSPVYGTSSCMLENKWVLFILQCPKVPWHWKNYRARFRVLRVLGDLWSRKCFFLLIRLCHSAFFSPPSSPFFLVNDQNILPTAVFATAFLR